ncbi:MAG TPA: 3-dehydroquinate synthase [Acidimicrobiia bacterium]|nr:3-dehydroquinate synthase [Acidimicrobiia bacterium]
MTTSVRVDLGARGYDVVIDDTYDELSRFVAGRRRVAVVTQPTVDRHVGELIRTRLADAAVAHETFLMGEGEDAKSLATVETLSRAFARSGILRGDLVVAVGGGVVGDTAGFVGAAYYRGIDVVQIPTTLVAMVDSAIGGKTGVNLPEGKNLVGAFHQPRAVFVNPVVLQTLPEREYRCGLGEIAKYALIGADFVSAQVEDLIGRDPGALAAVIARCVAIKAAVVAADEYERSGARAVLNYGHTLAHALETATGHALLHGEAVAIGLVFAAHLGAVLERVKPDVVSTTERLIRALGLPTDAPVGLHADDLIDLMARDKKSAGGLTFVLDGPNGIERVDNPDRDAVRKALAAIRVEA